MFRPIFVLGLALIPFGSLLACSSESPIGGTPDAAGGGAEAGSSESEAGAGTSADGGQAGLAPTKRTSLEVTIAGVTRTLDNGQFVREEGASGELLYIEAYEGGDPGCPTESSPTPDRTMIIDGLPVAAPGGVFTQADGIGVGLLDFVGDLVPGSPVARATAATITVVALDGTSSVEIEVDARFDQGTAKGRIHATYCEILSDRRDRNRDRVAATRPRDYAAVPRRAVDAGSALA